MKVFRSQTIEGKEIDKCLPSSEVVGKHASILKCQIVIYTLIKGFSESWGIRSRTHSYFLQKH